MDKINFIKLPKNRGVSISELAKQVGCDRKTVRKYADAPAAVAEPFKARRTTPIETYKPWIEDLLLVNDSITSRKRRLTAKRIHSLLAKGKAEDNIPACALSVRTVERAVRQIREKLDLNKKKCFIKLTHLQAEAQVDFGEVDVFMNGQPTRQSILILTLPFSNYRMARMLPAENFECVAQGLIDIFEELGHVPARIRFDNMTTAVSKVLTIDTQETVSDVWDAKDHPRKITDNFRQLMYAYGFVAEFCNASAGNEKGSVENAVGWVRRNFFIPLIAFDADYKKLNDRLSDFLKEEALQPHYRKQEKKIVELFREETPYMLELPSARFEACSWCTAVASNTGRVSVDTNEYQIEALPGEKIYVKKFWDHIEFYSATKELRRSTPRCYDNRKDFIDWSTEMTMLSERPSAFKNSSFALCLTAAACSYLTSLRAPKRRLFLNAFRQMLGHGESFDDIRQKLEQAIGSYGQLTPEDVVNAFRGIGVRTSDEIAPMLVPAFMRCQLSPVNTSVYEVVSNDLL